MKTKNFLTIAILAFVGYFIWQRFFSIPKDKRIEESFKEAKENEQQGFVANLFNNIRQLPIAFFGKLPLDNASANPLQAGNPVYDTIGEIQMLPRVPGSDMFSTLLKPEQSEKTFPSLNDPQAFSIRN